MLSSKLSIRALLLTGVIAMTWVACGPREAEEEVAEEATAEIPPLPDDPDDEDGYSPLAGYAAMTTPEDNPMTAQKAELGRKLWFDYRLSGDQSRSCYHCHVNEKGLTDGMPVAIGAYEKTLTRNSPTLWNIGYHAEFYWDGRSGSLEAQALAAWKGGNMGASEPQEAVDRISAVPEYRERFERVFGSEATVDNVPQALAAYMRTIIGGTTAWDRWRAGDETAVSEAAKRGYQTFQDAGCAECHAGMLFTDQQYHNVGIGMDAEEPDVGRFTVTELPQHTGAFKTPTLRDVARSGPYFHDGSVASLEETVRLMASGGIANEHLDQLMVDKQLSDEQIADVLAFLDSLTETAVLQEPEIPGES